MIELLIGAALVAGTLTWIRRESAASRQGAPVTGEEGASISGRRQVALALLLLLGITLVVSGITGT